MSNDSEFDPVAWYAKWCADGGMSDSYKSDESIRALAAESARRQAVKDAGICRTEKLCAEDEKYDNEIAKKIGEGSSYNLGMEYCAQAIEREAGLCK